MSLVGKKVGNYNVTQQLGEGGMGAVYLGEHPLIGKKVAIKVLHEELALKPDIVQRFFTEAKAVNDIHHENIVDIVDFGQMKDEQERELVYFLMECLEGESLASRLERGKVSHAETVHVIDQAASALAASHSHGIIHRDIKPDNIFLIARGNDDCFVKLLDFGIAKLTGGDTAGSSKTHTGAVIGTPAYMSPEQCDGKGKIDHRSDIYSLGVVMFEMLAGRAPFLGEGFGEILVAHLTQPPPRPSEFSPSVPPGLEAIVMRCLEKSRDVRFQSMDELRNALENSEAYVPPRRITGGVPVTAPHSSFATERPRTITGSSGELLKQGYAEQPPKSKTPIWIAAAAAVVVLGGGALVLARSSSPAKTPTALQPAAPTAAKDEAVHVLIDSAPQGASVKRAGQAQILGKTPLNLTLKRGEPTFDVLLSLDGFRNETRPIRTERDQELIISLAKLDAPPPTEKPAAVAVERVKPVKRAKAKPAAGPPVDPDGVMAPRL